MYLNLYKKIIRHWDPVLDMFGVTLLNWFIHITVNFNLFTLNFY